MFFLPDLVTIAALGAAYAIIAAVVLLLKWRRGGKPRVLREILKLCFFLYVLLLLYVTVMPNLDGFGRGGGYVSHNLTPFRSISEYFHFAEDGTINMDTIVRNLVGNILMFVPMGLLVPAIWPKFRRFWKTLLFGMVFSVGIELIQLLFSALGLAYRTTDVDDVILNTLGGIVGYGLFALVRLAIPSRNTSASKAGPPPDK